MLQLNTDHTVRKPLVGAGVLVLIFVFIVNLVAIVLWLERAFR